MRFISSRTLGFVCGILMAGQVNGQRNNNSNPDIDEGVPRIVGQEQFIHQGNAGVSLSKGFRITLDTNLITELEPIPVNFSGKLSDKQLDQIWEKLSSVLPTSTNFSIKNHYVNDDGIGKFLVYFESSQPDIDFSHASFVHGFVPYQNYSAQLAEPRLPDYFNPQSWTKEKGYTESLDFIENQYPVIPVTFVIQQLVTDSGEQDLDEYSALLKSINMPAKIHLFLLDDGTRAAQSYVDLKRLVELYEEPRVINIIPNLSK